MSSNTNNEEITCGNLYDYFVIEELTEINDGIRKTLSKKVITEGFYYIGKDGRDIDELDEKMSQEIRLTYDDFNAERSCMWVEEVKRRAKWVRGETLYGDSREKHYTYPIWWSRDKKNIGYSTWILEADGYVSFSLHNGYTDNETEYTKCNNYIRPNCLYNDKNCDEIKTLKK